MASVPLPHLGRQARVVLHGEVEVQGVALPGLLDPLLIEPVSGALRVAGEPQPGSLPPSTGRRHCSTKERGIRAASSSSAPARVTPWMQCRRRPRPLRRTGRRCSAAAPADTVSTPSGSAAPGTGIPSLSDRGSSSPVRFRRTALHGPAAQGEAPPLEAGHGPQEEGQA